MVVEELKQVKKAEDEAATAMSRARAESTDILKQAGERAEAALREARRQGLEEGKTEARAILEQAAEGAARVTEAAQKELQELEKSAGERRDQAIQRLLDVTGGA